MYKMVLHKQCKRMKAKHAHFYYGVYFCDDKCSEKQFIMPNVAPRGITLGKKIVSGFFIELQIQTKSKTFSLPLKSFELKRQRSKVFEQFEQNSWISNLLMEKIGRLENNLAIFLKLEYKGYISFQNNCELFFIGFSYVTKIAKTINIQFL